MCVTPPPPPIPDHHPADRHLTNMSSCLSFSAHPTCSAAYVLVFILQSLCISLVVWVPVLKQSLTIQLFGFLFSSRTTLSSCLSVCFQAEPPNAAVWVPVFKQKHPMLLSGCLFSSRATLSSCLDDCFQWEPYPAVWVSDFSWLMDCVTYYSLITVSMFQCHRHYAFHSPFAWQRGLFLLLKMFSNLCQTLIIQWQI